MVMFLELNKIFYLHEILYLASQPTIFGEKSVNKSSVVKVKMVIDVTNHAPTDKMAAKGLCVLTRPRQTKLYQPRDKFETIERGMMAPVNKNNESTITS